MAYTRQRSATTGANNKQAVPIYNPRHSADIANEQLDNPFDKLEQYLAEVLSGSGFFLSAATPLNNGIHSMRPLLGLRTMFAWLRRQRGAWRLICLPTASVRTSYVVNCCALNAVEARDSGLDCRARFEAFNSILLLLLPC